MLNPQTWRTLQVYICTSFVQVFLAVVWNNFVLLQKKIIKKCVIYILFFYFSLKLDTIYFANLSCVEVITSAEFHPINCNTLAYSSSKGSIRLIDMRQSALCDHHSQLYVYLISSIFLLPSEIVGFFLWLCAHLIWISLCFMQIWGAWGTGLKIFFYWDYCFNFWYQIFKRWEIHSKSWLHDIKGY